MGCRLTRDAKKQRKNNVTAKDDDVRDTKAVCRKKPCVEKITNEKVPDKIMDEP